MTVLKSIPSVPAELPKQLMDYADVFDGKSSGILPEHHPMEHRIDLEPGQELPWGPVYPLSEMELTILREYLDTSLEKGWIRRSTSPAGAPILFVPKKDGGLRLCVDYRGLNKVTIKNRTPLPLISETLDRLRRSKILIKLDLKDAYHRLRVREGDEWKTAFRTRYGHFEYCVLPFGLSNAPATFQAYINQALIGLVDVICIVYLDDILIFSEDVEDYTESVRKVFERLRTHKLYANEKKCVFGTDTVEFLGFIVGPKGIRMDPSRVATVKEWPEPGSFRDIQVFLGFTNFYRRFIRNYARVSYPLSNLLKGMERGRKTGPFRLTSEAIAAFNRLKEYFLQAPLLRHFDPLLRIMIETDASQFAIGGILSQLFGEGTEARWHPIAFYSKKLSPTESRYEVHDTELMAIVYAFRNWGQYLRGAPETVAVRTDHNNLKYFMTKRRLNGRQARWAESLANFDFNIEYRTGKTNPADGPSRRPDYRESKGSRDEDDESVLPSLHNKLRVASLWQWSFAHLTGKPLSVAAVLSRNGVHIEEGPRHPRTGEMLELGRRPYMRDAWAKKHCSRVGGTSPLLEPATGATGCKQCVPRAIAISMLSTETAYGEVTEPIRATLLKLQSQDAFVTEKAYESLPNSLRAGSEVHWRQDQQGLLRYKGAVYVPTEGAIRAEIIHMHHDDALAGHFGVRRTLELIQRKYYWQSLRRDVKKYIKSCPECQRGKARRHRPHGELAPIRTPSKPWEEIMIDFITDLPPSKKAGQVYDSILVIVDRFTKMARYIPVRKTIDAAELADLFINHIVKDFGIPKGITSDRGSVFTSKFWGTLMWYLQVWRRLSTAFHPQTDGQTERQNQVLEFYLRTYCNFRQDDWCSKLALAEFTYNNSVHATTGYPPFRLLYGFDPELGFNVEDDIPEGGAPLAQERIKLLIKEREDLIGTLKTAQDSHKKYYDRTHKPIRFKIGDKVILAAKNIRQLRPSKKLSDRYLGPFEVVKIMGEHGQAYQLKLPPSYRIHDVFHVSLLEPWDGRSGDEGEPEPIPIEGQLEYEVKSIQAHKETNSGRKYLVRWKGYSPAEDTWEPAANLGNAGEVVQQYLREAPAAIGGKKRRQNQGH